MEIRRATKADAVLVARLNDTVQALHATAHPHLFKAAPDRCAVEEWFSAFIARPGAAVLIGTVGGAPVGYGAGFVREYPDNPFRLRLLIGVVDQLVVEPAVRSRGYGGQLLDALIGQLRADGAERIELSVWAFNVGARRFYERRGFAVAHQLMALEW